MLINHHFKLFLEFYIPVRDSCNRKMAYSKEKCKSLLYYIAQAGNTIDGEGFIRTLAEKAPTYREDFMTIAEQLEAKGRKEGIQLGEQRLPARPTGWG